ncbi:hypothetical protein [Pseudonocardia alni]|uniref:Uncharacterized protein n=1 Tax=Pseudonocardia alni TaxID=33907 RepID=A0A852VY06_PSEA5|nr:hypothetical protein [Pseudonocardia antarctica]NYG00910.1 hypothetical protein [Pseudonocardia antarctica]
MSERYEMWTPAQAVDRLAADLPGGRADAEQVVASYLRDATGVHGRPSSGWRLDEFDLDDARARFGWVDFAGGETVAQARTRADAAAVAALRHARGTSAITERDRLAGLHSDAEMWGYRAHQVGLDELTNTSACDPQPRLVTVGREGRERSHREATVVHDARVAAAEVAALDERPHEQDHPGDDRRPQGTHDEQEVPVDTADRVPGHDVVRDVAGIESMLNAAHWTDVIDAVAAERGEQRDGRAGDGTGHSAGSAGGLWFTVDDNAEAGVRPLTETEMRRVADLVRDTQADVLAVEHDVPSAGLSSSPVDVDGAGWAR